MNALYSGSSKDLRISLVRPFDRFYAKTELNLGHEGMRRFPLLIRPGCPSMSCPFCAAQLSITLYLLGGSVHHDMERPESRQEKHPRLCRPSFCHCNLFLGDLTATLDDMDFELAKKRPATSCLFPHTALQLRCTRRELTM